MYAPCLVLCLVLVIVTGEVKSTKQLDNIEVSKGFFPFSNNSRRKPLEIDKNENHKLTNGFLKPGRDPRTAESSVKIKRSSNPRAISDLKLRIQRRRTETLCKFCRKSALRMKRALCKRCAHIIPSTTDKLTTTLPPAISRHGTRTANKKLKKPVSIKLNVPVRKINTLSNKDKIGLLQLKHNSNNLRSSENVNNELQNEKFLMANIHKPKVTIKNKLIKTKVQPIKLNNVNTNNSDFQISEHKLTNIKNKLFSSKIQLSDSHVSPTIKTKEYTISQNNIRKININNTTRPNLQNIRKKLFPSKFEISNTKITDTVKSNEMNTNIKVHPLNTNSSILRKTRNEKIETGSSMTMPGNSEQNKIRAFSKTNRGKILKSNLINTKNTSEDDKEEHISNVIENNKKIILNDLQNNTLPMEKRIHNSRLLNILTRKTNLQKAPFTDIHENGSSNLENVRSKRLKIINNKENTTSRSNVQLENTRTLTSLHPNGQIGNELKYSNNNKANLFSENSAIKKKSAFNIDLNTFELPLFETAITGDKSQLADENLLLSRVKYSNTGTNGKGRRSHDELIDKTQRKNNETSQIEIAAKKIQHFDRVVKENNNTLFKPSRSSLRKIQEGITENINEEHILGKTRKKSDIELRDSVHLTEDEVAMNDEYSDTSEIGNREKSIDFSGNENKIKKSENEKHRILKINIEKRSTIQSFTNSPQSHIPHSANNTMINRNDQKSTDQSTPESLVTNAQLRSQQFLNRKVYLKHPRLMSTYENGKHKYVLKMPPKPPYYTSHKWDILGMPIAVSTTTVTSAKSELSTTTNTPALETSSETNLKIKQKINTGTNSRKAENILQEHIPNPVLKETQNRRNIHVNQHINIKSNMSQNSENPKSQNSNEQKIVATNISKESDVMKHLRSQTFLNRNVYLKHPRLKSVYENGKHKYALSDPPKPPYNTKHQLNSSDLQRNVIITTEGPNFTNTISSTVKYPKITKTVNTMSNINSETEITTNKPNLENISMNLNPAFQSTINNKLLIKNGLQTQNKTNFASRNSEHINLKENTEEISDDFGNAVTTESSSNTLNINTHLSPQHFLNRKVYLKHPRIASVYENGEHKYILKEPPRPPYQTKFKWDNLGMPLTTSTTMEPNLITINLHQTTVSDIHDSVSTTKSNVDEIEMSNIKLESTTTENDAFAVLKNNNNSDDNKNRDLTNTKSIATLFNRNQNTKLRRIENNSEHFKRYLKSKFVSSNLNDNKNMYSNKEISENQNIFWKYLNMQPEINQEKYENIPIIDNKEQGLKEKRMNSRDTINIQSVESEKSSIPINFENITPDRLHKSGNKLNLPLLLKETENGGFELVLDTNRMCNCSRCDLDKHYVIQENTSIDNEEKELPSLVYDPKTLSKRKIEENLNKNPLNIFNILKQNNDMSSTQINNFLQTVKENKMTYDLNEQYLRSQIENKLIKLFQSLKIPVENVHEIYAYINDLPSQEKQVLENYLLNTVTKNFDEESNFEEFKNKFLQNMSSYLNSRFSHSQLNLKPTSASDIPERTTEGNYRIQLKMESEESDDFRQTSNLKDIDIKTLIREEINKELQKMIKDDDKNNIPVLSENSSEYGKRKKVLNKRHQDFFDEDINYSSGDVNPRGILKRKYKIVNNILNWARDCIVKP